MAAGSYYCSVESIKRYYIVLSVVNGFNSEIFFDCSNGLLGQYNAIRTPPVPLHLGRLWIQYVPILCAWNCPVPSAVQVDTRTLVTQMCQ